jgi:hypothetical protein
VPTESRIEAIVSPLLVTGPQGPYGRDTLRMGRTPDMAFV